MPHAPGDSPCPHERAFTLVEILVVLIIGAILLAVALPTLRTASRGPSSPTTALGAGQVWRQVQFWRIENEGVLPPASLLQDNTDGKGYGAGLVNPAGRRMIDRWPETGRGNPIALQISGADRPPATGDADTIVYAVGAGGATGWIAAYSPDGKRIFQRGITTSPALRPEG